MMVIVVAFPGSSGLSAFSFSEVNDRQVNVSVSGSDSTGVVGHEQRSSVEIGSSNEELFTLTNGMNSQVTSEINIQDSINWKSVSQDVQTLDSGESTIYVVDTSSVSDKVEKGDYIIRNSKGSFIVEIQRTVRFSNTLEDLILEPSKASSSSLHTWSYAKDLEYNGEIDTVAVNYPSGTSFDGLTDENVTVTMTRQLSSGKDTSEISVNSDSYSGSAATFSLSGSFDTTYADFIEVEIDGINNPPSGSYQADITFDGDETITKSASLEVSDNPIFISDLRFTGPQRVDEKSDFTIDYEGAGSNPEINFQYFVDGNKVNENTITGTQGADTITDSYTWSTEGKGTVEVVATDSSDRDIESATFDVTDDLSTEPDTAFSPSVHTWQYFDDLVYNGEIDTITVDYPQGTSFDGLTDEDVTVTMTRQLSSGKDTSQISVNSDSYSGSTATFDLSGRSTTDYAGFIKVEIDGVENPSSGSYTADITFNGDDTVTKSADLDISP